MIRLREDDNLICKGEPDVAVARGTERSWLLCLAPWRIPTSLAGHPSRPVQIPTSQDTHFPCQTCLRTGDVPGKTRWSSIGCFRRNRLERKTTRTIGARDACGITCIHCRLWVDNAAPYTLRKVLRQGIRNRFVVMGYEHCRHHVFPSRSSRSAMRAEC